MELDMSGTLFDVSRLGDDGDLSKKMLDGSAPYVKDVLHDNLESVIGKDLKGESRSTKMKKDGDGYWNVKIGFAGTDSRGVRNGLKAGVLEYGKSYQQARPFVRPTAKQVKHRVTKLMKEIVDAEIRNGGEK